MVNLNLLIKIPHR